MLYILKIQEDIRHEIGNCFQRWKKGDFRRCRKFQRNRGTNYKKRMQRQQTDIINKANKDILEDLLKVVDDFDRVQDSMKTYERNPVIEGIKLVYNNLLKVLSNEGCEKIQCKSGDVFDVNFHEAVASLPHEPGQKNSGTIAQVMQTGWLLNGNLLLLFIRQSIHYFSF